MAFVIKHNLAGDHVATMATGKLLGRSTAGAGSVEELTTATLLAPYVLKAGDTMTGALFSSGATGGFFAIDRASGADYGGIYHNSDATWLYNSNYGGSGFLSGDANGTVTIPAGQIKFPAAQNASSDANTFDDYEEGTFTFTDGSGAGLSLTCETAFYIKIGRLVWFTCGSITYPATASAAQAKLSGLPFTVHNATVTYHGVRPGFHTAGAKEPGGLALTNTTSVYLYQNQDATALTNAEFSAQTLYGFTGCYLASA